MMGLSEKVVADYVNVIKNSEKQPIEGSLEYAGATDESYKQYLPQFDRASLEIQHDGSVVKDLVKNCDQYALYAGDCSCTGKEK